jgi:hypothetical protein
MHRRHFLCGTRSFAAPSARDACSLRASPKARQAFGFFCFGFFGSFFWRSRLPMAVSSPSMRRLAGRGAVRRV